MARLSPLGYLGFLVFLLCSLSLFGKSTEAPAKPAVGIKLAAASSTKRTRIEFQEQEIKGVRRIPLGSLITKERSNARVELILMRKSWKSLIIASAKKI